MNRSALQDLADRVLTIRAQSVLAKEETQPEGEAFTITINLKDGGSETLTLYKPKEQKDPYGLRLSNRDHGFTLTKYTAEKIVEAKREALLRESIVTQQPG